MVTDGTRRVSGDLTPESEGDYVPFGTFSGKTTYRRDDGAWFIWWSIVASGWVISIGVDVPGANSWLRIDPAIDGNYNPQGGAAGIATVTEI